MAIMSLAEAKAELEQEEKLESPEKPVEKGEVIEEQEPAEKLEPESEAPVSTDWMKGDEEEETDQTEKQEDTFSSSDVAKVRRKFKGRLKVEKDENEKLREEKAALERQVQELAKKPSATVTNEPKREQYKSDVEYQKALTVYLLDEREQRQQSEQAVVQHRRQMEQTQQVISQNVEAHYTRRAELAKKSGITDEAMGAAEKNFRQAIDDVRPGLGDTVVDGLIHILGKGSEMVIHKLGVSRAARDKAMQLLKDDPTGSFLIAYAAEMKASLSAPMKRESSAPEPPQRIQGDKSNTSSASRLKKEYDAAEKSGDTQKVWNIRKEARAKGVDVSNW